MSFNKGQVSVIVPCLNGERHLHRLLTSLLKQTYTDIQFIFVNDGSTDGTETVFREYEDKLHLKGIKTIYLSQENKGQASAINTALPHVTGEFLMWMDADDFITEDCIENKTGMLIENVGVPIVVCKGRVVEEDDINNQIGILEYRNRTGYLFEDILFGYSGCTNGLFMVRTVSFFEIFKDKKIYESRTGQNLQMILPLTYKYRTVFLNRYLFTYVVRKDSHSHDYYTCEERLNRAEEIYKLKKNVLERMSQSFSNEYKNYLGQILGIKYDLGCLYILGEYEDGKYEERIQDILGRLLKNIDVGNRRLRIWGATRRNDIIAMHIGNYMRIQIDGFIDSDEGLQDGLKIISPDEIDREMYVIVLLKPHKEIVEKLKSAGMIEEKDYCYPEYAIEEEIKRKNEKSRDSHFSICR